MIWPGHIWVTTLGQAVVQVLSYMTYDPYGDGFSSSQLGWVKLMFAVGYFGQRNGPHWKYQEIIDVKYREIIDVKYQEIIDVKYREIIDVKYREIIDVKY
uniref:Uncharacterized protein n=1 Tax=Cacopsylla melanoneura TaxID=428564 RepID=A0A8D8QHC4_9HEMI